jgi:outer membrane protein OmpA-like peptidoglycan-associated protein
MFTRFVIKRGGKDEGERPFWISYSDLMTALMALFLVVMCVTLLAVTKNVSVEEQRKIQREADIKALMAKVLEQSRKWPQVKVDADTYRIDLGDIVHFESGQATISKAGQEFLRSYIPSILEIYRTEAGHRWIRRIVVEGFTDTDGTYLFNLGLSLERSKRVVCALFDQPSPSERPITDSDKAEIRDLFLVGGYSFNSIKASKESSRRVELKIDFWQLNEEVKPPPSLVGKAFGQC